MFACERASFSGSNFSSVSAFPDPSDWPSLGSLSRDTATSARTRSSTGFNTIPENVAAVVFSHLGDDPRDRIALAQVSRVWRDAERTDASLPVAPSALIELAHDVGKQQYHELYWMSKAADLGDAEAMYWLGRFFEGRADEIEEYEEQTWMLYLTKAYQWFERASECGHAEASELFRRRRVSVP